MLGSLKVTVQESIRYRGRSGHYSWLAHRLTGLAILGFLVIHTWDGSNLYYAPNAWAWTVNLFKNPIFGVGEIAVFGAVIYHSFNGLRITLLDFKPEWWHHQARSSTFVWALFLILFIPAALYLFYGMIQSCSEPTIWTWAGNSVTGDSCFSVPPFDLFGLDNFFSLFTGG